MGGCRFDAWRKRGANLDFFAFFLRENEMMKNVNRILATVFLFRRVMKYCFCRSFRQKFEWLKEKNFDVLPSLIVGRI